MPPNRTAEVIIYMYSHNDINNHHSVFHGLCISLTRTWNPLSTLLDSNCVSCFNLKVTPFPFALLVCCTCSSLTSPHLIYIWESVQWSQFGVFFPPVAECFCTCSLDLFECWIFVLPLSDLFMATLTLTSMLLTSILKVGYLGHHRSVYSIFFSYQTEAVFMYTNGKWCHHKLFTSLS